MFKLTKPIVASAIIISLAACGTTPEKSDKNSQNQNVTQGTKSFDEKDLKMKSAAYLEQFQKNDFDQLYKNVTQEMTSKLPKEEFASKWRSLTSQLGPALNTESEVFNSKDKNGKVSITTVHRKNNLQTTFVYTKDGKVADIQTQMQPLIVKPKEGEKWEESSIKVGYNEKKLNGLLTLPKGIEKPPVAILLQGLVPIIWILSLAQALIVLLRILHTVWQKRELLLSVMTNALMPIRMMFLMWKQNI